ncbi:MAG TPA: tetratricopeptide repeat protein, partial [Verrucomicrobiae bacterium]|nr:tetratricopeptide repeat protein [Verrucomicrobiae bacterium]
MSIRKKVLFGAVACAGILLLAEVALAFFGVKPMRYERDPYVGFSGRLPLFVRQRDLMVTAENKRRIFNYQQFPARKSKNAFRIFCMGGSTTYGHPYTDATSFCGWLRAMLPKADPSREWELINCGGVSYASYREALLMEELTKYQPDLFIILTGHNEFLEQRTFGQLKRMPQIVRDADALLSKTRTYSALKRGIDRQHKEQQTLPAEVDAILDHTVGPQAYHRDDALRRSVIEHFRFNLRRMVNIAHSAGAKVMLVTPAVNLRECAPFKSEHRAGIGAGELAEWQKRVRKTDVSDLEEAVRIDPQRADAQYALAQALWESNRFDEARAAFLRALDYDVCPLRALPEMTDAMRDLARNRKVTIVDFVKLLESKSPHGVPGEDWFLDHVHPTIEGHRVLALAIVDKMAEQGCLHFSPNWNIGVQLEIKRAVESALTPKDHGIALCTLAKVIAWVGKDAEAYRIAVRARALAPDDPAVHFEIGKNAARVGKKEEALESLKRAVSLQPNFAEAKALLASALIDAGQFDEALRLNEEAVAIHPDDARLRLVSAGLLSRLNRLPEASDACREALRINPDYPEAHNTLAWLLKDQGKLTEAMDHFREAVRLRPGLVQAMMGLASLLATHPESHLRNPPEALRLAQRVVELSP